MTNTDSRIVQLASAGDGRMGGQDLGGLPQGVAFEAHVVLKQHGWRMLAEYRHSPASDVNPLMVFDNACLWETVPSPTRSVDPTPLRIKLRCALGTQLTIRR